MKSSFRFLCFALSILLFLLILFPGREFFIHFFVEPITRILWWLIRILQTIDQKFYWTILIFLVFVFIIYLVPGRNNIQPQSAYTAHQQKEDRWQFWKRSISSANENDADRKILQSNLDQLRKEVSLICENSETEQIQLNPIKNNLERNFYSLFSKTALFSYLLRKNIIRNNDSYLHIQDFLKSLETSMEIKNGKNENKSSIS